MVTRDVQGGVHQEVTPLQGTAFAPQRGASPWPPKWSLIFTPFWLWFLQWALAGETPSWNVGSFSFSVAEMSGVSRQGRALGPGGLWNPRLPVRRPG